MNLIPYLDVVTNLVMFMLLSMTGFIAYQTTNASLAQALSSLTKQGLGVSAAPTLEIRVTQGGFDRGLDGHALQSIANDPSGQTEFAALAVVAARIKESFPTATKVTLRADQAISYDRIIQTMDTVHGTADQPLFPSVAIGVPIAMERTLK